ncbi:MAG: hypothetical protein HOL37_06520 [Rhodospirillaceae bacterium]|nr:hypothetical protein [Rhodospirillaceae bacterium]MBT4220211.1 hypothetical protein [Rhodospirillaceae bacterium]MBT4464529.1 hypothetical protein [Rhodospirillaceae bacterium]MBT5013261.1 hypothetical protein [Rhodospirillaceae bacterium]MBT5308970.1 hypothetical protein [Rhodospirillaceae bacterium]
MEDFFFGVMIQQEGKWTPHSKFDGQSFGSALMKAESLDEGNDYEAVKVLRIPNPGNDGEQKEMWISPHLKARAAAKAAAQMNAGAKQSKQQLDNDHAQRKATANKA